MYDFSSLVTSRISSAVSCEGDVRFADSVSPSADDTLLNELMQLWEPHRRHGLDVRYQTGVLLNERFGKQSKRQRYGGETLKRFASALGLAQSELSRMRRFASTFGSVDELRAQHPDIVTWTEVKILLATLTDRRRAGGKATPAKPYRPKGRLGCTIRAIKSVGKRVGRLNLKPTDPDWKKLYAAVCDMVAAAAKCLGVTVRHWETPDVTELAGLAPVGANEQA
jgi:hypothetical protein